ncbi:MAG: J domain-containing protein [Sandaracinaceae bacterium]
MSDQLELLDYYTLLGVDRGASADAVKAAFRDFARRYHPDRFGGAPEDKLRRATQIYRRGSEAYQILSNPVSRKAYDRVLRVGRMRLSAEERDKAAQEERPAAAPAPQKKPENPIRSTAALEFYHRSAEAARAGNWRDAWKSMKRAVEIEPENELLRGRLTQIEAKLRTSR